MIRRDEYKLLPKYLEGTEHRFQVAEECYIEVAIEGLTEAYLVELRSHDQDRLEVYIKLVA